MRARRSFDPASRGWWRDAVFYQIYPRSWADSNGDGIGDIRGIIERLDHLEWLGVDAIWLNPVTESPDKDWGYDVSDYKSIHPELGTMKDVEDLIREAGARDIKVVFDLVPNHSSDQHPWFQDALSSREARHRDKYVWADPRDGGPPNNWMSVFGGSAWEFHEETGQYYLHNFLRHQPDLNWWNEEVKEAFDDILRFWLDRGAAGFRIDVAHGIVKDRELRDNLPAEEEDHPLVRHVGQRSVYNLNRPEVHDVLRRWRQLCDSYDPKRILIGETFVLDLQEMAAYYGGGDDELNLAFNFPFCLSPFEPQGLREVVEATEKLIPPNGWPAWMGSNHDVGRFPSRWCGGQDDATRCALMMLLTLRGTPFLYYGDEIGMPETKMRKEDLKDPVGKRFWTDELGRDPARTPMPWSAEEGAGFTSPDATPWLPFGDFQRVNVAAQRRDPDSILNLCRDLVALRVDLPALRQGPYASVTAPDAIWAWRRGTNVIVVVNLSDRDAEIERVVGVVRVGTRRARDGERVEGRLRLGAWEGAIVQEDA